LVVAQIAHKQILREIKRNSGEKKDNYTKERNENGVAARGEEEPNVGVG
jgi:hypothetical protein